jgi:hypothetical protein
MIGSLIVRGREVIVCIILLTQGGSQWIAIGAAIAGRRLAVRDTVGNPFQRPPPSDTVIIGLMETMPQKRTGMARKPARIKGRRNCQDGNNLSRGETVGERRPHHRGS